MQAKETPWERCPRCGAGRVKIERTAERMGRDTARPLMVLVFLAEAAWWLGQTQRWPDMTDLFFFLFIAIPGLVIAWPFCVAIGTYMCKHDKSYTGTCSDCGYIWKVGERAAQQPQPTGPTQ